MMVLSVLLGIPMDFPSQGKNYVLQIYSYGSHLWNALCAIS